MESVETLFTWAVKKHKYPKPYYRVENYNSDTGFWEPYVEVDELHQAKYWARHVNKSGESARVSKVHST